MNTPLKCPACHGSLELVTDGAVGVLKHSGYHLASKSDFHHTSKLEYVMEQRPFLACGSCEFCVEVNLATGMVVPS